MHIHFFGFGLNFFNIPECFANVRQFQSDHAAADAFICFILLYGFDFYYLTRCWNRLISNIEHDIHGRQSLAYKVVKVLNNQENDVMQINNIDEEWIDHYKRIWYNQNTNETIIQEYKVIDLEVIDLTELTKAFEATINRKATGINGINTEVFLSENPTPI